MTNPVLVEVLRGGRVESRHGGSIAVCDAHGGLFLARGDVARPVFPRSAVKVMQALPLVESGAADAFGFDARELALACASHSGEPEHAALAKKILAKAGFDPARLVIPGLDERFILSKSGAAAEPGPARILPTAVSRPDWHNARARLLLDLNARLEALPNDAAREALLAALARSVSESAAVDAGQGGAAHEAAV